MDLVEECYKLLSCFPLEERFGFPYKSGELLVRSPPILPKGLEDGTRVILLDSWQLLVAPSMNVGLIRLLFSAWALTGNALSTLHRTDDLSKMLYAMHRCLQTNIRAAELATGVRRNELLFE